MSIFDCPIARCEVMRTLVVTDQTQAQCAHENGCPPGTDCPLAGYFSGLEWAEGVRSGGAGGEVVPVATGHPRRKRRPVGGLPQVGRGG